MTEKKLIGFFKNGVFDTVARSKQSILISYDIGPLMGLRKMEKHLIAEGGSFHNVEIEKVLSGGDVWILLINGKLERYWFEWTSAALPSPENCCAHLFSCSQDYIKKFDNKVEINEEDRIQFRDLYLMGMGTKRGLVQCKEPIRRLLSKYNIETARGKVVINE